MTCNRADNNRSIVYVRVLAHRYNLLGNLHINIRVLRETIYPHHIPAVFEIRGVEGGNPLNNCTSPWYLCFPRGLRVGPLKTPPPPTTTKYQNVFCKLLQAPKHPYK